MVQYSFMNSIFEAIQGFLIATVTVVSTTVSAALPIQLVTPQPTPLESISANSASGSANQSVVLLIASGEYSYLNQTIKYQVTFPKDGGQINGNFEGPCSGSLNGNYDQDTQSVNGKLNGKCKFAFIEQEILGHYSGEVNTDQNTVNIDWVNDGLYGPKQGTISLKISQAN